MSIYKGVSCNLFALTNGGIVIILNTCPTVPVFMLVLHVLERTETIMLVSVPITLLRRAGVLLCALLLVGVVRILRMRSTLR